MPVRGVSWQESRGGVVGFDKTPFYQDAQTQKKNMIIVTLTVMEKTVDALDDHIKRRS